MAGSSYVSKPVQELVTNNEELPERYVYKGSEKRAFDGALPYVDIPVVDLSILSSSSPTGKEELNKLRSVLSSWGCFQAINHGIASEFLDKLRGSAKEFFALPMEEKQKYSRAADDLDGYGNDTILWENQILDWTDRLYLTVWPTGQRKLRHWPENPANFGEMLLEYTVKTEQITKLLLEVTARSLNLEDQIFLDQYGEGATMVARFNFFPKCPRPDLILGLKSHADGSVITILLQDKEVEGLQIFKDNQWFRVPIIPHALLIIAGDQIEIMSNGIFKSPVHRVVTNAEKERISVAVFTGPEQDKEIGPANGLINENRPRLYKTAKNYMDTYFQYYQQGKRPIEAAKI